MGKTLSEDNHTADFTVCCETKEFRVHKAVFCARYRIISQNIQISDCLFRSPVFRATILSDMEEAKKGEIFIPEIDEKTLSSVIYTGQLEMSEDQNIQQMIYAVDKYDLSGFMSLFCSNMSKFVDGVRESVSSHPLQLAGQLSKVWDSGDGWTR